MNKTKIKLFEVIGLFGTDDVSIPFKDNYKILIGENGLGKTQVLNLFYYTLTQNFIKLSEYNFKNIRIVFSNNKTVEISKKQVDELVEHPVVKNLISEVGYSQFVMLRNKFLAHKMGVDTIIVPEYDGFDGLSALFPEQAEKALREQRVFDALERIEYKQTQTNVFHLDKCEAEITNELKGLEILYFPTYRRVEEDLHNLGYDEKKISNNQENNLIQFGMGDVKRRFINIQETIDKLLKEGLAQFTKDILNVVIDDAVPSENILDEINEDDLEIILSRVGKQLPDSQKEAVKNIVASKEIKNPLSAYLLQKLVDIYEKQKEIDNSVKFFRDACNKYLINKSVYYDESAIDIYIKSTRTDDRIDLKHLSSGEKQMVSMLSKVYLSEADKRFIILFDEPELSLSMTWQKQLLPDIINSNKCDFLLAVTHSPFIFDNELDKFAVGMNEYVKPSKILVKQ